MQNPTYRGCKRYPLIDQNSRSVSFSTVLRTNKHVFLLFMVWLVVSAFVGAGQAQERDLSIPSVRAEYVAELAEISRTAKAEAEAFAQSLGIPIRIDDGTKVMELMSN